ncbi:MAG: hypothetical protein M3Q07_14405 [Pseudobdellovibrionaceae bacterium]|nr:hypothetical protein [Pseudobdellovibrionaceae bacterium]
MRSILLGLFIGLVACSENRSGPSAPDECSGETCLDPFSNSDQSSTLQLEQTYTHSHDILVSWDEIPGISEYTLDLAEDEACLLPKKTLSVTGPSVHLIDLEEGVWYLCLKSSQGLPVGSKSQLLVVDRQGPALDGALEQNLTSGGQPSLTIQDRTETQCRWTTNDDRLKIVQPGTLLSTFTIEASGTYPATLICEDLANNSSIFSLTLNVAVGAATLGPAPADVVSLAATPAVNSVSLSWADGGGAQSYLVLASSSPITATPLNGMFYSVGSLLGGATVKAVSNATTLVDTSLPGTTTRYYKVFAASTTGRYAAGVAVTATPIANKVLKSSFTRNGLLAYSEVLGVRTSGNYSYVCRGVAGLSIVNVSNPANPTQTGFISMGNTSTSGWCSDVKIVGNYAYVANWDKGLIVVDVTNPAAPVMKDSFPLTNASVVYVEGNFAYVAVEDNARGGGLAIINISNPDDITQSSFTASSGHGAGIYKIGNFVYLTHRDTGTFKGLKIYDVTTPASPSLARTISRPSMEDIDVRDNHAYITVGSAGLEIFDVSTPSNPISRSTIATTGNGVVLGVSVVDNHAFVTDYTFSKMYAIDVSNKTAPTLARSYSANNGTLYLHVNGGFVYMTVENRGLEIIEVFQFL